MLNRESIVGKFGSRRGFVRHCQYSLFYKLGRYQCYQSIDWNSINRLIFVCKGNICRSAFAELVARKEGVKALSCGIDTIEYAPANDSAIIVAQELGYDLSSHKTTPIQLLTFRKTDLLVAMEPLQAEFLSKYVVKQHSCTLLGLWFNPARPYIHDPYGLDSVYFKNCFNFIKNSTQEIVKNVAKGK